MPIYNNTPFKPPVILLTTGVPEYLFGAVNQDQPYSRMQVTNDAGSGATATLTVTLIEGNIPSVGDLVSVQGTQNSAGAFNVSATALTAVSITPSTGQGTIQFASATSQASTADAGRAISVPQPTSDSISVTGTASVPFTVNFNNPDATGARSLNIATQFTGTLPTTATLSLQVANRDNNTDYSTLATVATVVSGGVTQSDAEITLVTGRFYRLAITGTLTGTANLYASVVTG